MNFPILQTTNLSDIYPDISEQLCNKHVKRLSQLKSTFADIYDEMQPEGYVLVNGVAKVVELGSDLRLNFALENGVTILFSKTYKNEDIYINGNHIEEEIIFNSKGRHEDGIHQKIDQIKQIIKIIRKNSSKGKQFYGGIVYVHSNIGQNLLAFNECFIAGVTLAMLILHEEQHNYNTSSLIELMTTADSSLQKKTLSNLIQKYEMYKMIAESCFTSTKPANVEEADFDLMLCDPRSSKSIGTDRTNESKQSIKNSHDKIVSKKDNSKESSKENAKSHNSISSLEEQELSQQEKKFLNINLKSNHKLILCKLDLAKEQEESYSSKMNRINLISNLLQEHNIHKKDLLTQDNDVIVPQTLKGIIVEEDYALIKYYEEMRTLLNNLANGAVEFDDFMTRKHVLDIQYEIHDLQVVDLLDELQQHTRYLQHFCVIEGSILLISMDRQHYAQIMVYLRHLLNNYKLSTFRYLASVQKLQCESKYDDISEIMFTTMPCVGCAIYKPNESAWI